MAIDEVLQENVGGGGAVIQAWQTVKRATILITESGLLTISLSSM
jgi:hypothetical protein